MLLPPDSLMAEGCRIVVIPKLYSNRYQFSFVSNSLIPTYHDHHFLLLSSDAAGFPFPWSTTYPVDPKTGYPTKEVSLQEKFIITFLEIHF